MGLSNLDQWLVRRMAWSGEADVPAAREVRAWQFARIRELVAHAQKNSPFYVQHLAGINAGAIGSVEDYSQLPFITPSDICSGPERFLCVSQDEISRAVTLQSSGTTGLPKRIFHTEEDLEATTDYFRWGMSNLVGPGETALVLMPGERPGGVGRLLVDALERAGARAVPLGIMEDVGSAVDQCLQLGAECIVGAASHINMMAREWARRGLPKNQVRSVLLCWDVAPAAVVQSVNANFGCQVFRHWGMIETGLGGAVECRPGSGMHLRETDVFLEIVDPDTGKLLPEGVYGEMVVTTPLRRGMPLIRYRTGDMGRILPNNCSCGSPLRRLDPHVYRRNEGVDVGSGFLTLQDLNEALFAVPEVDDFAAWFADGVLHLLVCGSGPTLPDRLGMVLGAIPIIRYSVENQTLELVIETKNDGAPAVPGLGKRRIQKDMRK